MTSAHQAALLGFLRTSEPTAAAKALFKRTSNEFVLEYGWWYEPVELPKQIVVGEPSECHKNAVDLTVADSSLIYCEGFAIFKTMATRHAWVTDGYGRAIENTWPQPGVAYAGIPFQSVFVTMTALRNHAIVSLLDDYQSNWPLLGDLGDHPGEWLELRGRGMKRIIGEGTEA